MKLLLIVAHPQYYIGGAEIQAYRLAKEFAKIGYEVSFLMTKPASIKRNTFNVCDDSGFQIYFYKEYRLIKLSSIFKAYNAIKTINPDFIYLRGSIYAWPAAFLFSRRKYSEVPILWQVRSGRSLIRFSNTKELFRSSNVLSILFNLINNLSKDIIQLYTIRYSSLIISQTNGNKETLKKVFKRDSILVKKGIYLNQDEYTKDAFLPMKVYFIRNIKPHSRINLFLDVYKYIQDSKDKDFFEFNIIGENQIKENLSILEQKPRIRYHGKLRNEEILKHLRSAHILIDTLKEYNDQTTFSNVFLEAWANRVVVCSFDTNPDHVLTDQNIGFKVNSVEECALKLIDLRNNRELWETIAANAFNYVKDQHSLKTEVLSLNATMQSCVH